MDPLTCTGCGKKIKITAFITNAAQIHRILRGIGWPVVVPEFDPPYDLVNWDVCDLVPDTHDGFPEPEQQVHCDIGPDPPLSSHKPAKLCKKTKPKTIWEVNSSPSPRFPLSPTREKRGEGLEFPILLPS